MIIRRKGRTIRSRTTRGKITGKIAKSRTTRKKITGGSLRTGPLERRSLGRSQVAMSPVAVPCSDSCSVP